MYHKQQKFFSELSDSEIKEILSSHIYKSWLDREVPIIFDPTNYNKMFYGRIKNNYFKVYHTRYHSSGKPFLYPIVFGKFYTKNSQTLIELRPRMPIMGCALFLFLICLSLVYFLSFIILGIMENLVYCLIFSVIALSLHLFFLGNCKQILIDLEILLSIKESDL